MLRMTLCSDLPRAQPIRSASYPLPQAQQLSHAAFLQPSRPSQSPLLTSDPPIQAISTLLHGAGWRVPTPQPDALRLILALAAAPAAAAPFAGPPRF